MIDRTLFSKKLLVLCERFGRTFSALTFQQYYECLSKHLTTEEFQAAVDQTFFNSEFFPSPKELIEAGKTSATMQVYQLPWTEIKAYADMTPIEQQEYRAQIDRARQQLSPHLTSVAKSLEMVESELAQKRRWLEDPVLRDEAIRWAIEHPHVRLIESEGAIVGFEEAS